MDTFFPQSSWFHAATNLGNHSHRTLGSIEERRSSGHAFLFCLYVLPSKLWKSLELNLCFSSRSASWYNAYFIPSRSPQCTSCCCYTCSWFLECAANLDCTRRWWRSQRSFLEPIYWWQTEYHHSYIHRYADQWGSHKNQKSVPCSVQSPTQHSLLCVCGGGECLWEGTNGDNCVYHK